MYPFIFSEWRAFIQIPLSFTVGEVKVLLARKTGTPPENQIIVFSGKKMDDDVIFAGENLSDTSQNP